MKTPKKEKISIKVKLRKYVAQPLSFATVIVLATYGMRQALQNIDNRANVVITTLSILALVYIMLDD